MYIINRLYILIFGVIFMATIAVNTRISIKTYMQFYHPEDHGERLEKNHIYSFFSFIDDVHVFLSYTGLETGFGFFAPNVASEYITEFRVFDKDSTLLFTSNFPKMENKESLIRLSSAYQLFDIYFEENQDSIKKKKSDVFLKGLSFKILSEKEEAAYVETDVFLYHHPLLEQLRENPDMQPLYVPLTSIRCTKEESWENYFN